MQYATFFIHDLMFGVDVHEVQEIIKYQEMTPVPLAPVTIKGLINLRGQIIAAIDLRQRLNFFCDEVVLEPMNVVVKLGSEVISLLVDRVGDVVELENVPYENTPDTLPEDLRRFTRRVFKMPDGLMLDLNASEVVNL